jgi:biopolymer transport protein ExbD
MEYLLKSMLCLVVLLLIHRLFLQREVMHQFNRFFLLGAVVFSFLIPFNSIEVAAEKEERAYSEIAEIEVLDEFVFPEQSFPQENFTVEKAQSPDQPIPWNEVLWAIYCLITLVLLARFIRNIKVLMDQVQQNLKVTYKGMTLVLLPKASLPYTFLKYVFVTKTDFENGDLADAIIEHEYTHVKEGHSYDILFLEVLLIPFWFHPGLYLAKHAIRLNHEFIADQKALKITSLYTYQKMLLALASQEVRFSLVSNLNFSLTKKRLKMMKQQSNPFQKWIKMLVMIPVLGALVYVFSEKVEANQEPEVEGQEDVLLSDEIEKDFTLNSDGTFFYQGKNYQISQLPGILENLDGEHTIINIFANSEVKMGVIQDFQSALREKDIRRIKYLTGDKQSDELSKVEFYKNVSFIIALKDGEKIEKTYDELPADLKVGLMDPPKKPSHKIPTEQQFEAWKNSKEFAVWIDQKVISNDVLEKRNVSDFVYYFDSFVHDNARSERFPQAHQVTLYTEEGFENAFGENSGFGKATKGVTTIYLGEYDKWPPAEEKEKEESALRSYSKLNSDYEKMRTQEPHFINRSEEEQQKLLAQFSELGGLYFRIPLELKQTAKRPVHPFSPYMKLESEEGVYYKLREDLTEEEKNQLPPPPPISSKDKVTAYQEIYLKYELLRQEGRTYSSKSMEDREYMFELFTNIQEQYLALNAVQRRQVKHVNFPFIPMEENGELTFKVFDELTPEQRAFAGC